MAGSLDQYLAIRLTAGSVFQVVTDPQKADAVFTERIGAGFEETLKELYATKESKDKESDDAGHPTMRPLSRGKGSLFLVDRKTKNVVWSLYEAPKGLTANNMSQLAEKIVNKLQKDLRAK